MQRPAAFRVIYPGTYADNGIHLLGKYTHSSGRVLGYEAAVVQGLRGFRREDLPGPLDLRDNNDTPQAGGRIYFEFSPALSVGASYTAGYYDDDDSNLQDYFGGDLRFDAVGFQVRSEYLGNHVRDTAEFGDIFRHGFYVHVEREFVLDLPWMYSLIPVARVDWMHWDDGVDDNFDMTRVSVGLAALLNQYIRVKLEYAVSDERADDVANDGLLAQIVLSWY